MRAHETLDFVGVGVGDRPSPRRDACVVHEDVDRTERVDGCRGRGLHLVEHVDGAGDGDGAAAHRFDLRDGLVRGLLVAPVVDRDVGTVLRERERDRPSDTASATGHQRDATLQCIRGHAGCHSAEHPRRPQVPSLRSSLRWEAGTRGS